MQWSREASHGYDTFGPLHMMYLTAGLDSAGKIVAHKFDMWGSGIEGSSGGQRYTFGNAPANFMRIGGNPTGGAFFTTSALRAPNGPATAWGGESFIDELAHAAKADPIQFRLLHLDRSNSTQTRVADTLLAAGEKFGWETRPSPNPANAGNTTGKVRGRGIAHGGFGGGFTSTIVEVEVDQSTGEVRMLRAVVGFDCGLVVNPESVRQQVEGNTAQGIGRALWEEVRHDGFRVRTVDWIDYPVTRVADVPHTEVVLVNNGTHVSQGGVGEPAIVPVAAAIGNAIFDATGVRIRQVPLTPERVLEALRNSR
jgi:CO/xanthine dehydrogenase Mo-binding subunit